MSLPLIRPDVRFDEVEDDLRAIFESGILTSGPYVARFEEALAEMVGVAHVVTTTSATSALHLSLAALGIERGDEVLVSDFTFPASGNVIAELGATPVLVDSCRDRFALDIDAAATLITEQTKAIMVVDPFGQPADLAAARRLADAHGLALVEDAACALGSSVDGTACGAWPLAGCFSFHPRKVVTTGEGGAVTTDDGDLALRLRRLRNHGGTRASVGLEFVEHGYNYRLSEIAAAVGLAQLRRMADILADRRRTAEIYNEMLPTVAGVQLRLPGPGETWSYQSYVVMVDDEVDRNAVVRQLAAEGIETTLGTYAMHAQPAFAGYGYEPGDLPHSWRAQEQSLTLPVVPDMARSDIEWVVERLSLAVGKNRRDG